MKKVLITGSLGFVGGYLRSEFTYYDYEVIGVDVCSGENTIASNLLDAQEIDSIIFKEKPDVIVHLAGQASVSKSWAKPKETFENNVIASINLLEAIKKNCRRSHVVIVGSSDQYGNLKNEGANVVETIEMKPKTPYAISKKTQEEIATLYAKTYNLNLYMTRTFNHSGAGQKEGFLIPDLCAGIVRVENGLNSSLRIGNTDSYRDFTHVKDVVRAYRLLSEKGVAGEVYNIGSGRAYGVKELLDKLIFLAKCPIPIERDPEKMRPVDTSIICCNHNKITEHVGWIPSISIDNVLEETLQYYRKIL